MATTIQSTTIQTRPAPGRANTRPPTPVLRGRRRPLPVIAGAVLVVAFTAAFMWIQLRSDDTAAVLVVNRAVSAGAVITAADVRTARVTPDPVVDLIRADDVDTVLGRSAAVPLLAGTLLSRRQLGPAVFPGSGQAVIALPVAAGRLPTGLTAGARVQVITIVAATVGATRPVPVPATVAPIGTVMAVTADVDAAGTTVVSLLLPTDAAIAVAGSPAEFTLALLPPIS